MNILLQTRQKELEAKRLELKKFFDDHRDSASGELKMSVDDITEVNRRNDELAELGKAFDELYALYATDEKNAQELARMTEAQRGFVQPGAGGHDQTARDRERLSKSLGQQFVESVEYKTSGGRMGANGPTIRIPDADLKTLMQRTAGWDPEEIRNRGVVYAAQRPIQVTDLIPTRQVTQDAIKYMEETTFTNNAAEAAEGATYGEAALALTERSQVVEKIGVWLPVTDEQMEDVTGIQGYIDNRLPFMIRQRLDYQILRGTGVTPNLLGVLAATGLQTQAKGADPTPDAIYKAMTKVRVTGRATPGALVIHPNDWQEIRLLRTADGIYIWGSPSDAGPERIWGISVVQSDALAEGTAVLGDWQMYSELAYKRGIEMQSTNAHSDYFINGKQAIRADVRCVVVWYRGAAFCQITGI